jgi:hypothetical protein
MRAGPDGKEDFSDGDSYLRLQGHEIGTPENKYLRPDPEAFAWHNDERFRG